MEAANAVLCPGTTHTHARARNRNFRSAARAATGHVTPPPTPYVGRGDRNGFHLTRVAALPCRRRRRRCFAWTTKTICGAVAVGRRSNLT